MTTARTNAMPTALRAPSARMLRAVESSERSRIVSAFARGGKLPHEGRDPDDAECPGGCLGQLEQGPREDPEHERRDQGHGERRGHRRADDDRRAGGLTLD